MLSNFFDGGASGTNVSVELSANQKLRIPKETCLCYLFYLS